MVALNMNMPETCNCCKLNYDCIKCIITGSEFYKDTDPDEGRLPDCPLIGVNRSQ